MVPLHGDLDHIAFDSDLTAKIMRKRQDEAQRRVKLLDPRKRMFGVDPAVLDEQLAEKRAIAQAEVEIEDVYAQQQLLQEQVLQQVEDIKQATARARQVAAVDYSLSHLRKEQRREFALSDPTAIRREKLPGDGGVPLGPSAMQTFEGQNRVSLEWKKEVQKQQAEWLREQMREKQERQQAEKDLDRWQEEKAAHANQIRAVCEEAELQDQREEKRREAETNRQLAEAHRARRQEQLHKDVDLKARHNDTVISTDRHREMCDWQIGSHGRLLRTEYKRLSLEEEQEVYNANAKLVLQQRGKKQAAEVEQAEEAAHVAGMAAVLGAVEFEKLRQQKERRQRINEFNDNLAQAKKANDAKGRKAYLAFDYEP